MQNKLRFNVNSENINSQVTSHNVVCYNRMGYYNWYKHVIKTGTIIRRLIINPRCKQAGESLARELIFLTAAEGRGPQQPGPILSHAADDSNKQTFNTSFPGGGGVGGGR